MINFKNSIQIHIVDEYFDRFNDYRKSVSTDLSTNASNGIEVEENSN